MIDWDHMKPDDHRPKRHGWAPGGYTAKCRSCGDDFTGDKRAYQCADCAYAIPLLASARIIGLTGKRHVGKSTVADYLKTRGWQSVHPFAGGKIMVLPYLERLGIPHATAERMVYGDLKDVAHPLLPGDGKCRTLMEKLGAFMPRELGPEWTIGVELKLARIADPVAKLIVESVVYEADEIRSAGGIIIRVIRPGHDGPEGMMTDAAEAGIQADLEIVNDGTVEALHGKFDELFGFDIAKAA